MALLFTLQRHVHRFGAARGADGGDAGEVGVMGVAIGETLGTSKWVTAAAISRWRRSAP